MTNIPSNEIHYTSTNGKIIENFDINAFGANLVSNVYHNNHGILTFSNKITRIGESAFFTCEKLETVLLPETLQIIESRAFGGCNNLQEINIPDKIKHIGVCAFEGCSSITRIIIPDSIKIIGNGAFKDCDNLREIGLPQNFSADGNIFDGCSNIQAINTNHISDDGHCIIINNVLISCLERLDLPILKEYRIPEGVIAIGKDAFHRNKTLRKIYIPKTVKEIECNAFVSCNQLQFLEFESEKPPIFGERAFYDNACGLSALVPPNSIIEYKKRFKKINTDIFVFDSTKYNETIDEIVNGSIFDNDFSAEELENLAIGFERNRNIAAAVKLFEKVITKGNDYYDYSFQYLITRYNARKDIDNEIRVLSKATNALQKSSNIAAKRMHYEYSIRLNKLLSKSKNDILPTEAKIPNIKIIHGDIYEQRLRELPEFNFYKGPIPCSWTHDGTRTQQLLAPIGKIIDYFQKLIEKAKTAESTKDYVAAAYIYEQITREKYWKPDPYDRLIMIYSKAILYDEEIRVLKSSIEHFTKLRKSRYEYLNNLAKKYNANIEDATNKHGVINYYCGWQGDINLYNPFPIIKKWEDRLAKKLK